MDADVIVGGGGLAGLVASNELVGAGKRVAILTRGTQRIWAGRLVFPIIS